MHGNSVALAGMTMDTEAEIDLLLVSSMTNLPAFLSLTNPRFSDVPKIMYMHENQFTQPMPEWEERDLTYCYINYLSALSADKLIFSSKFHLQDFLEALPDFLDNYPADKHHHTIERIEDKSIVLYPGIDLQSFDKHPDNREDNKNPVIVWNQRWQFDRNPSLFFRVLNRLDDIGLSFDLILAGDTKHDKPLEFEKAWKRYSERILHFGYVEDPAAYSKLLHQGDIVISTASYEFFCIPILEAIYCGCHPLLPDRLHYTELIPDTLKNPLLHAPVLYRNEDELFDHLKDLLEGKTHSLPKPSLQSIAEPLDWENMISRYDQLLTESEQLNIEPAL
jgi:glycosyltransferase involved in cell wall biosynthesis